MKKSIYGFGTIQFPSTLKEKSLSSTMMFNYSSSSANYHLVISAITLSHST